ncbi:YxD-tail cyclophane-containing RiPP peptide [Streptomyces sp. NPDC050504]|uniref:YxD-tail cyclophane-containing RiPP peptide n=1 Tax=Streptomyces sp. NPDC050504 TaxID=3365618 RepID=UPI0037B80E3E
MQTPAVSTPGEALPDFSGVDLAELRARGGHPVLDAVLQGLLEDPREESDTVAMYDDSP